MRTVGNGSSGARWGAAATNCSYTARIAPNGHVSGWEGEHRVGLIELGEPLGVAGVGPLHEEPRQVFGLRSPFTSSSHRQPHFPQTAGCSAG